MGQSREKRFKRIQKITFFWIVLTLFLLILAVLAEYSTKNVSSAADNSASIVIERESGRILFSDNIDKPLPVASTTKILTALTVIENVENLDEKVSVPAEAVGIEGSSIYLKEGELLSYRELLYGLMLRSGNDAAVALAVKTSGSVESFVNKMNETAALCGAVNCNFVNPHGLHDDKHLCTARGLALICAKAFEYPDFGEIVSTKSVKISGEPQRYLQNKNKMLWNFEGADGVKTGYTKKSGRCLVSSATRKGMRLISVVLNCNDMWNVSNNLLNNAFSAYEKYQLVDKNDIYGITVRTNKKVFAQPEFSFSYPLTADEYGRIETDISLPKSLNRPVKAGKSVGEISVRLDNRLLFSSHLYTMQI